MGIRGENGFKKKQIDTSTKKKKKRKRQLTIRNQGWGD